MKKILLVDGNNLIFRSYFATAYNGVIMKNSKGFPTNALYSFINMINKIIREEKPSYILVAFDKGKTFRHEKYDGYKAGRSATPIELKQQIPVAKDVLDALGIKYFEMDNYEADDIIGTLSVMALDDPDFVCQIVSSDKDLFQLIGKECSVKIPKNNDYIIMDENSFFEKYGVEPKKMIDLKALMGDSSDNIPGVLGVGEKTAITLIKEYGSIDNIYNNIDNIKGKLKEKLINGKESCYKSLELVKIITNINLGFSLDDCVHKSINEEKLKNILEELEFNSLLRKYNLLDNKIKNNNIIFKDISELDINSLFSFYLETSGDVYGKSKIIGISFFDGKYSYFLEEKDICNNLNIFSGSGEKFTYDLKKVLVVLSKYNIKFNNINFDTMVAAYLCDMEVKEDIAFLSKYFDIDIPLYEDFYGTLKKPKDVFLEEVKQMCASKSIFIFKSKDSLMSKIKLFDVLELFEKIEMPLVYVLASMEIEGIKINKEYLEKIGEDLVLKLKDLEAEIYSLANCKFNILSPVQLGKVLFVDLGIVYPKKVKDNKFSTSKDILDKIKDDNLIVKKVLEYRALSKIYSNYVIGLINEIRDDGRIHTIYNQTLTKTGRLSSVSPNLQNIPMRDDYARLIRKAFISDDDSLLLSSDYSQIELRIFASMSNASNMISAFVHDKDIHTKTASDIFNVSLDDVTSNMRRSAKAVNFGIIYGISSFGLSEDLGINIKDAKKFIDDYLNTFPGIKDYMENEKQEAYKNGYVKTLMNRRRVIEELDSKNYIVRSAGERMALNTPIQGTAADILKKAMVELYNKMNSLNLKSKLLLQVHDELVINVKKDELDVMKELVKDTMENVFKLKVPLKVEIEIGDNWYEAK